MIKDKKGLTLEEKNYFRNNSELERRCRVCEKSLPYKNFSCRNEKNGLIYFSYECNKCAYHRKLKVHEKNLTKYTDTQRFKENFTIDGRAIMLRNRCKQRSRIYKMEYSLTKNHILKLLHDKVCAKTGIELIIDDSIYNPYAPSIDRIDSNKGYTDDNIQVVCMIYNFCKNKFTEDQVSEFFNKITK